MPGILDGIRVLDFGRYIAGPACGMLLADYGAEVIRIEKLAGSEDRYTTPLDENLTGAIFVEVNRNKKGMTLNPMKPEGREILEWMGSDGVRPVRKEWLEKLEKRFDAKA